MFWRRQPCFGDIQVWSLNLSGPGVRNSACGKRDNWDTLTLPSPILSSITALKTDLFLPESLESQSFVKNDSSVLIGDFPSEVKISIHDSTPIAVVIIRMQKLALLPMRSEVLILFGVMIYGVFSTVGCQWGGEWVRKQHAKHSSHFFTFPSKTKPQDSISGAFNSFYSSG